MSRLGRERKKANMPEPVTISGAVIAGIVLGTMSLLGFTVKIFRIDGKMHKLYTGYHAKKKMMLNGTGPAPHHQLWKPTLFLQMLGRTDVHCGCSAESCRCAADAADAAGAAVPDSEIGALNYLIKRGTKAPSTRWAAKRHTQALPDYEFEDENGVTHCTSGRVRENSINIPYKHATYISLCVPYSMYKNVIQRRVIAKREWDSAQVQLKKAPRYAWWFGGGVQQGHRPKIYEEKRARAAYKRLEKAEHAPIVILRIKGFVEEDRKTDAIVLKGITLEVGSQYRYLLGEEKPVLGSVLSHTYNDNIRKEEQAAAELKGQEEQAAAEEAERLRQEQEAGLAALRETADSFTAEAATRSERAHLLGQVGAVAVEMATGIGIRRRPCASATTHNANT